MPRSPRSLRELIARTRWYVYLRWAMLLLIIVPSLIASFVDVGWGDRFVRDLAIGGIALMTNTVFHVLTYTLKRRSQVKVLAYMLVLIDVVIVTLFLHTKGGIESRSVILYVLPMVAAAAILGRKGTYIATFAAIIGFTSIILGAYFGVLGHPLSAYTPQLDKDPGYVANTVVFFDFVLLVIAIGFDYMTRLLIQGEQRAQEALVNMRQAQLTAKAGSWEYDRATNEFRCSEELFSVISDIVRYPIITGEEYIGLVHLEDRPSIRRKITGALRRPLAYSTEHRIVSKSGIVRYIRVDAQSVPSRKTGRISKIIGTMRDISEEKALQKARNDFVALASHQLRTPATIVKQYTGMLRDGFVGDMTDEQKQILGIVYDTNERQIKIVNDLLNVARIDSNSYKIDRQRSDLSELLSRIVRDQESKFSKKDQSISLRGVSKPVFAKVDPDGLRMAVDNLIDNAYKYSPAGTTIRLILQRKAKTAAISIIDRGVGINKDDLPKLFKLFSRVENPMILQEEGTGLGLYWADRIVRLHKGKITVTSEVGKGTAFTITVPLT